MKAYGSGCMDLQYLDLGTSWRWVKFTPRPLYPQGKSPRYPLDRRLGGPQSQSGWFREEKILHPTGTRTPTPPLGLREVEAPTFSDIRLIDGSKLASPTRRPFENLKNQSHIATDGLSISKSWCQTPIWGSWPNIYYSLEITVLFSWGSLSDERTGLSFV
jgi:hypothetical protein